MRRKRCDEPLLLRVNAKWFGVVQIVETQWLGDGGGETLCAETSSTSGGISTIEMHLIRDMVVYGLRMLTLLTLGEFEHNRSRS